MAMMLRDKNSNFVGMGKSKDTLRYVFDDKQIACVFREVKLQVLYTAICCKNYAAVLVTTWKAYADTKLI